MMGTERFPETLCLLSELTRLTAREDFIATCCRESFKSHIIVIIAATAGENGYTCEHCSKAFNRRSRLIMHVKYVHEGAKPYECEQCTKTFVRKEDLARHAVLHTGIKGGNAVSH
jgi:uncharacterized Zn-finger protein